MNLSDFEKTNYSGLYVSKAAHPTFGKNILQDFSMKEKDT